MSNLPDRLRAYLVRDDRADHNNGLVHSAICHEAAAEIERLNARLKVLQDAAAYTDEAQPWVRSITLDTQERINALQGEQGE